jgi:phosphomannomutase
LNQIGDENLNLFSWKLNHNGLHKFNGLSFKDFMGEKHFMKFINIILKNLSKIEIPKKRGRFIEYKNDLLSISPIGFDSNDEEKDEFEKYDNKYSIIKNLIEMIKKDWYNYCYYDEESFSSLNKIDFSIVEKISFNIFPEGHDKITSLQLNECKEIYYFMNNLNINYELLNKLTTIHNKVTIYKVKTYKDTLERINKI